MQRSLNKSALLSGLSHGQYCGVSARIGDIYPKLSVSLSICKQIGLVFARNEHLIDI